MDFCTRACEAAWDVWFLLRGSERESMFTSCLANGWLEQVNVVFLWWLPTAKNFNFWVAGTTKTVDTNGVFSMVYLFVESHL